MLWKMFCERCNTDWYTDGSETTCEACKRPASYARKPTDQEWAEIHNTEPFDITNEE